MKMLPWLYGSDCCCLPVMISWSVVCVYWTAFFVNMALPGSASYINTARLSGLFTCLPERGSNTHTGQSSGQIQGKQYSILVGRSGQAVKQGLGQLS